MIAEKWATKHIKTFSNLAKLAFNNYVLSNKKLDLTPWYIYMNKKNHKCLNENWVPRNSTELFYSHPCLTFHETSYIDAGSMKDIVH